ncbi:hypothetical protein KP509_06G068300 [Ceratopteris richardii]|nr:hypothetical protein KP509_06G068300 [Ceratopteris richardii]
MFDCILQERLTPMRHPDIKYRGAQSKIDVTDIKNAISALISTRRFEDLADVEDFLQCYTRLNCPYFTNMVNEFFCDIYNDILQCEACFDERFPLIQRFV